MKQTAAKQITLNGVTFQQTNPFLWQKNPFDQLHHGWGLLSAGNKKAANTMTVSWGGVGVLWNKPVVFAFVRPQRHTLSFLNGSEAFSLAFFGDEQKEALTFCGRNSGRDVDKFDACGLHYEMLAEAPVILEAKTVFCCQKLFCQKFDPASFCLPEVEAQNYPNKDHHFMFIGEITHLLERP